MIRRYKHVNYYFLPLFKNPIPPLPSFSPPLCAVVRTAMEKVHHLPPSNTTTATNEHHLCVLVHGYVLSLFLAVITVVQSVVNKIYIRHIIM